MPSLVLSSSYVGQPCRRASNAGLIIVMATVVVLGCSAPSGKRSLPVEPASLFSDVTAAAHLLDFRHSTGAVGQRWFPEITGSGAGFVDVDNDGWLDIVLVAGGTWPDLGQAPVPAIRLYRNRQDGTFEDVTMEAGLSTLYAYGQGIAAADVDRDGDLDLYLTAVGQNLLLRNDGGRFTEIASESGVAGSPVWSTAAVFLDADRDGWLDLYVGNYVAWSPLTDRFCPLPDGTKSYCTPEEYTGASPFFFRNNGDGTFAEVTNRAGIGPQAGKTMGAVSLDFDRDGWPDLAVANDTEADLLYHNNRDGTFSEIGLTAGFALDPRGRARAGMGIDAGVVDDSDLETIFVGNFSREMMSVFRCHLARPFEERATISGIGRGSLPTVTFGLATFDVDLDGDLDVMAANGHVLAGMDDGDGYITFRQRAQLFVNDGSGNFVEWAEPDSVLGQRILARGLATGDFDRDGDLDVLITENGSRVHLWRNETLQASGTILTITKQASGGPAPHYLRLRLVGRHGEANSPGARVVAKIGDRRLHRYVRSGGSYLSQSQMDVHFGFGPARRVDSLWVFWPGGAVQRFVDIGANQELLITEGLEEVIVLPPPANAAASV